MLRLGVRTNLHSRLPTYDNSKASSTSHRCRRRCVMAAQHSSIAGAGVAAAAAAGVLPLVAVDEQSQEVKRRNSRE